MRYPAWLDKRHRHEHHGIEELEEDLKTLNITFE